MTDSTKRNEDLVHRLDVVISEIEHHKTIKDLQKNYYVVLQEMKNLRDGNPVGS